MSWTLKSESDLEQVFAQTVHGRETGRYRYCYPDGRVVEVGTAGTDGRKRKARHPRQIRNLTLAAAAGIAVVEAIRLVVG